MAAVAQQRKPAGGARKAPPCQVLRKLVAEGMTQQQIADWTLENTGEEISRSGIAQALAACGLTTKRPRPRYSDVIPWRVREDHLQHKFAKVLRTLAREQEGKQLSPRERVRLDNFKALLDQLGASVWYEPDHPDVFVFVERRKGERYIRFPDA